jgi:hypothetical protein
VEGGFASCSMQWCAGTRLGCRCTTLDSFPFLLGFGLQSEWPQTYLVECWRLATFQPSGSTIISTLAVTHGAVGRPSNVNHAKLLGHFELTPAIVIFFVVRATKCILGIWAGKIPNYSSSHHWLVGECAYECGCTCTFESGLGNLEGQYAGTPLEIRV